jgi:hypothetical protein
MGSSAQVLSPRAPPIRGRARARLRRAGLVCTVVGVVPLLAPGVAGAHLRVGTVAVDYRATLTARRRPAFSARVYQTDRALRLSVARGHSVVVRGYLGEPFLRLDDAGLAVNAVSPTSFGTGLLPKGAFVAGTKVAWRLQPGRRSIVWHDRRVQGLPPGVTRGRWTVPILVDGHPARLQGELVRVPPPAVWPWAGTALVPAAALVLLLAFRRRRVQTGAVVVALFACIAAVSTALGFALDTYASPGTWIAGLDELVFVAVGVGVLAWGPPAARAPAAIGLGAVSTAVGISKGAVLLHPIVLSVVPGALARLLVAVAIGAGVAAMVAGGMSMPSLFAARTPVTRRS